MSSRSREIRNEYILSGSPIRHHSMNQSWMRRVAHGERRHNFALLNKKIRRAVRNVLTQQGVMESYWETVRTGHPTEEYLDALDARGVVPPTGFLSEFPTNRPT